MSLARYRPCSVGALCAVALMAATSAIAQQLPPAAGPLPPAAPKSQPKAGALPKSPPAKEAARPADGGDGQLRGRIEHLEEQLADMQVVIGTLESLGRAGQAGGPAGSTRPASGGSVDQARIDSLETQIRALVNQVEQLQGQVRQLSSGRRAEASAGPGAIASGPLPPAGAPLPGGFGRDPGPTPPGTEAPAGGFGSTTVTPGDRDPIGRMLGGNAPQPASASPGLPPAAASAGNARELYETAYGYLLQQDYGAAEVGFEEFLRRYPGDRLEADAQYWLGEALYVQRRYKPAGQAFLAVIEKHKGSAKVPNSLLKLAQSLDQLGQKDCGIFNELETRHPNAPADVRTRARALKQKQGC